MKNETKIKVLLFILKAAFLLILGFNVNSDSQERPVYNLISILGTILFTGVALTEFKNNRIFIASIGLAGVILFQPIMPVIKKGMSYGEVDVNNILEQYVCVGLLIWLLIDLGIYITVGVKKYLHNKTEP